MKYGEKGFLGAGIKFPPQVDKTTGRFLLSHLEDNVKQSILILLKTAKGERLLLPDFGSGISRYAFEEMDLTTVTMMRNEICRLILKQEPRVRDVQVEVYPDQADGSRLLVDIGYVIDDTNRPDNLVFPYYLNWYEEAEHEIL